MRYNSKSVLSTLLTCSLSNPSLEDFKYSISRKSYYSMKIWISNRRKFQPRKNIREFLLLPIIVISFFIWLFFIPRSNIFLQSSSVLSFHTRVIFLLLLDEWPESQLTHRPHQSLQSYDNNQLLIYQQFLYDMFESIQHQFLRLITRWISSPMLIHIHRIYCILIWNYCLSNGNISYFAYCCHLKCLMISPCALKFFVISR